MRRALLCMSLALVVPVAAWSQVAGLSVPGSVVAGSPFSVVTSGSGKAAFYLSGPGGILRRDMELGTTLQFSAADIYNAGHYIAILVAASSTSTGTLDVLPAPHPETLSFLARPSRLPVGVHSGISGTVYIFDAYRNLITTPGSISFQLSTPTSPLQARTVGSRNGVAWTTMDSTPKEGRARFVAQTGGITSTRVIDEVPGDPCGLIMSARQNGHRVQLDTAPVRDCGGNPVPDGTIVTFTETYNGVQSTVDAPLKQGTAHAEVPAVRGARLSVASGVIAGNEIRWGGSQ